MRLRSGPGSAARAVIMRAAAILVVASLASAGVCLADSHADLLRAHEAFHSALRDADSPEIGRASCRERVYVLV